VKAAQFSRFGGPEVLDIVNLPDPHPGSDEIRIAVRAAGVNASDWKKRQGLMDQELPQTMGYEAAGIVDELGAGVSDVAVGDRVFGASPYGAAQAELAVLTSYAPIPPTLDFAAAAALPTAVETAARALDQLGVAIIGTGRIAHSHMRALSQHAPARTVAIFDVLQDRAAALTYYGVLAIFPAITALVTCGARKRAWAARLMPSAASSSRAFASSWRKMSSA